MTTRVFVEDITHLVHARESCDITESFSVRARQPGRAPHLVSHNMTTDDIMALSPMVRCPCLAAAMSHVTATYHRVVALSTTHITSFAELGHAIAEVSDITQARDSIIRRAVPGDAEIVAEIDGLLTHWPAIEHSTRARLAKLEDESALHRRILVMLWPELPDPYAEMVATAERIVDEAHQDRHHTVADPPPALSMDSWRTSIMAGHNLDAARIHAHQAIDDLTVLLGPLAAYQALDAALDTAEWALETMLDAWPRTLQMVVLNRWDRLLVSRPWLAELIGRYAITSYTPLCTGMAWPGLVVAGATSARCRPHLALTDPSGVAPDSPDGVWFGPLTSVSPELSALVDTTVTLWRDRVPPAHLGTLPPDVDFTPQEALNLAQATLA